MLNNQEFPVARPQVRSFCALEFHNGMDLTIQLIETGHILVRQNPPRNFDK